MHKEQDNMAHRTILLGIALHLQIERNKGIRGFQGRSGAPTAGRLFPLPFKGAGGLGEIPKCILLKHKPFLADVAN
jgi:hypothetical protein